MNPLKQLAGQTAIYGVSSILGRVLNYLMVPLHTNVFIDKAKYGIITELYAYVAVLIVLLTYGMETTFFRFSSTEKDKKSVYSTVLISVLSTSAIFISIATIFTDNIASLLDYSANTKYISWFIIIITLDAVSAIPFAKLRELNKAKKFAIIKIINIGVNIGLNLFFYFDFASFSIIKGASIDGVFIANLVASAITILLLIPEMINIKFVFKPDLWKKMIRYSYPLLIAGLAGVLNEMLDRILIKHILPENEAMELLGIYGACFKISIIMVILNQAFRYAAEPFFFSKANGTDSKKIFADIMKYFVIILSFVFLSVMMYMEIVIHFIGGPYRVGAAVIPILLLAKLSLGIFYNLSVWYKLTDKTRFGAIITIIGVIITISLNFILVPKIGYMGCAWASLACFSTMTIISYFWGRKHYPIKYDLKRILGYIAVAVSLYLINKLINIDSQVLRLSVNTLFILIYVMVVYLVEKPDIKKLRSVFSRNA